MAFDQDLRYLRASSDSLEDYLLSDELFWPLGGANLLEGPSTRLSLGILDLSLARLSAAPLTEGQMQEYHQLRDQIEATKHRWRAAWGRKAAREFQSRLHLWENNLSDLLQDVDRNAHNYPQEVRMRVMLELLHGDADPLSPEYETLLEGVDRRLRAHFIPGDFVWDPTLASAFPKDRFWYLYGKLKG